MGRPKDSDRIDLHQVFLRVQRQMLAQLDVGGLFQHPTPVGEATEKGWLALFQQYLPHRYRASSAFVVDADGRRSRQIDIAVYDALYHPLVFPHDSGPHLPAESVYAVFEVKRTLTHAWLADAAAKAASVRALRRTSIPITVAGRRRPAIKPLPILAGVLSLNSVWPRSFSARLPALLARLPPNSRLDLGCILKDGAFENQSINKSTNQKIFLSSPDHALIFFVLRLLHRLQQMGASPAIDLVEYARVLASRS